MTGLELCAVRLPETLIFIHPRNPLFLYVQPVYPRQTVIMSMQAIPMKSEMNAGFLEPEDDRLQNGQHVIDNFLRVHSKNYQLTQNDTFDLQTDGTDEWLLKSAPYTTWKAGTGLKLACTGHAGAGKTVMSSVIIEDLKRTLPKATLLFLYIDSISNKIQSPHAFVLNLLSQVLKQSQDSDPLARDIAQLFVHQPSNLPGDLDAATSALRSELKRCSRVFLVVDALDEYRSGSPEDQTRLVQELESFGVSLLITSRSAVPFTGEHASCEVSATPGDIRRFAGTTLSMGDLQNILKYDPDMKEDVIDELLKCSDGTFLKPKLVLSYLARCKTPVEVKKTLDHAASLTVDELYKATFDDIQEETPWALRLLSLLSVAEDVCMGAGAAQQFLDFQQQQQDDDIKERVRPANKWIAACRGLVVLVNQDSVEDSVRLAPKTRSSASKEVVHISRARMKRGLRELEDYESPISGQCFRFSHATVRDFFQRSPSVLHIDNAKLDLIHTLLQYMPHMLDRLATNSDDGVDMATFNELSNAQFLATHHPLTWYTGLWLYHTDGLEDKILSSSIDACYDHPKFRWLISSLAEAPYRSMPDLPTSLSTHGLLPLLQAYFIRHPDASLQTDGVSQITALGEAARLGYFAIAALLLEHDPEVNLPHSDTKGMTPLDFAAERGDFDITSLLLANGASVHVHGAPLLHACRNGHWDIATLLLQSGASANETGEGGKTALIHASILGDWSLATTLVREGARVNARDEKGMTSLAHACRGGHNDVVSLLLANGADLAVPNNHGDTPLMHALKGGHADTALLIISKGSPVNVANEDGETTLMLASGFDRVDVVSQVISRGVAAVSSRDRSGRTPLMYASKNGCCDNASALLTNGAAANQTDDLGQTSLLIASSAGHAAVASLLLRNGATTSTADKEGTTSITKAAQNGHTSAVQVLVQAGAEVNVKDGRGDTALIHAVRNNHPSITSILLDNGANIDEATQKDRQTPLMIASVHNFDDTAAVLLKHGASQEPVDRDGWTAFAHAACRGHTSIIAMFLEHGHAVDIQDKDGWTPLIFASSYNHVDVVTMLLQGGASVDLADSRQWSPLMHATHKRNKEVATKLLENGAQVDHKNDRGRTVLQWAEQYQKSMLSVLRPSLRIEDGRQPHQDPLVPHLLD